MRRGEPPGQVRRGGPEGQVRRGNRRGRWLRGGGEGTAPAAPAGRAALRGRKPPSIGVAAPRGSPRAGRRRREGRREWARRRAGARCPGDAGVSCGGGAERRRRSRARRAAPCPGPGAWAAGPREQQRPEPPAPPRQPRQVPAGAGSPARRAGGMRNFVPARPLRRREGRGPGRAEPRAPAAAGSEPCAPGSGSGREGFPGALPHPRLGGAGTARLTALPAAAGPQPVGGSALRARRGVAGWARAGPAAGRVLLLPSVLVCTLLLPV